MYSSTLLSLLAAGSTLVSAFPANSEAATSLDILTGRAIGSACSTPYGSGTCKSTSSCTTSGFNLAGYCPNDPTSVECCVEKTCSTSTGSGVCMNTADTCGGHFVAGACPGPSTVQCCAAAKCSTSSGSGTCQNTGTACGGKYIAGACPGPSDIQCCVPQTTTTKCSTADGAGVCQNTATACNGGHYVAGACPGPSNIECCVAGSAPPPPPPPSGELKACDLSSAPSSSFYSCAKSGGLQKIVARGYSQSCGSGGAVDKTMVTVYNAAKAAGIPSFDAYMYPCTGSSNGVACKPIQTQLNEFLAAIDSNGISVNYLWFDIEPTSTAGGDPCNSWQLGAAGNEALAKQWVAALKASGRKWGIYANAGQWTSMFASSSTDIGSDLPLWAVQDDFKPGVSTTTRFMGGWTKAFAKQYNLGTTLCGASVDLDSFSA